MMSFIQRLRSFLRPPTLSRAEREQAARLGVYCIEAEGFDWHERGRFSLTVGVYLNAREADDHLRHPPTRPTWEDVLYKRCGPRALLGLLECRALGVTEAKALLARAANGEAHEILPAPLTAAEWRRAARVQIYLIWYEDKFHEGSEPDSFATSVCLNREEAEAEYRNLSEDPTSAGGDGYEIVGPSPLASQPAEVVREVLRRLRAGEPGPIPIPAIYF